MPNEPQRPIEDLLATYKQIRREQVGASLELHPTTRKVLQDEVVRAFPPRPAASNSRFDWLRALSLRVAWAGSLVVVLGVAAVLFVQNREPTRGKLEMASQDRQPAERKSSALWDLSSERQNRSEVSGNVSAPLAAPIIDEISTNSISTGPPIERYAGILDTPPQKTRSELALGRSDTGTAVQEESGAVDLSYSSQVKDVTVSRSQSDADKLASVRSRANSTGTEGLARRYGAAPQPRPGVPASPIPAPAAAPAARALARAAPDAVELRAGLESSDLFTNFGSRGSPFTQNFTHTARYRRNFNSPVRPEVLNSFRLEQDGAQVRIVDADGSVYSGAVRPSDTAVGIPSVALQATSDALAESRRAVVQNVGRAAPESQTAGQPTSQNFLFTVDGTNRTLNQTVVFYGNYIADTNALPLGSSNDQAPPARSFAVPAGTATIQNQLQFRNVLVQGRAVIGTSNRIEVNAVLAEP